MSDTISAQAITQWVHLSAQLLEQSQAEINRINVFPIADADTGSNMAHTVRAASAEVEWAIDHGELPATSEMTDAHLAQLTALLATGAVKGARGNSGMVLSQVFRALSNATGRGKITSRELVETLESAVRLVQESISSPVEGTILTVLRESAAGARAALELNARLDQVAQACLQAAEKALAETPRQLPALAEAGVHDAGGAGFILILDALTTVLGASATQDPLSPQGASHPMGSTSGPAANQTVEYEPARPGAELELMYLFDGPVDTLREYLEAHGNSVIIAPVDEGSHKVHVHSTHAGEIIEESYRLGGVTQLRIEVLPPRTVAPTPRRERIKRPVIALVPEAGTTASQEEAQKHIFSTAGALCLSAHAGEEDIARAFEKMPRPEFAVLTNGSDAEAVQAVAQDHPEYTLHIIDTSSQVAGLAALAVFDPTKGWKANTSEMLDAAASQRWWQGAPQDAPAAVEDLLEKGGELVTIISSSQETTSKLKEYARTASGEHPGVEFHAHRALGLGDLVQVGVE